MTDWMTTQKSLRLTTETHRQKDWETDGKDQWTDGQTKGCAKLAGWITEVSWRTDREIDRQKQTNIQYMMYINADRLQPKQSKEPSSYYTVTNLIKSRKWQTKSQFLQETNTLKLPGFSITSGNWDRQISTAKSHACLPGKKGERKTYDYICQKHFSTSKHQA